MSNFSNFCEKIKTEAYKPIETRLSWFDSVMGGGVIPQSTCSLLAAPGAGKTSMCLQLSHAMAQNEMDVIYLNLEMSEEYMFAKSVSLILAEDKRVCSIEKVLNGWNWKDEEKVYIPAALDVYRDCINPHLTFKPDTVTKELSSIKNWIEQEGMKAKEKGKRGPALVVDYLHLISDGRTDVAETIKNALEIFKTYAIRYDTFVIYICAINRESMKKGVITLNSGRDSSGIEYNGDYCLALNFWDFEKTDLTPEDEEKYEELMSGDVRHMLLKNLKHRIGKPCRAVELDFFGEQNRFALHPGSKTTKPITKPAGKRTRV